MAIKASSKSQGLASAEVATWLRNGIRTGRFVPGQRLVEADIIRDTGATRSRVRDAIQRLESEGLIAVEEFRGASVRSFSDEEVRQIYRARMALEGLAAHDFAAADDPLRKLELVRLQDAMNPLESSGDHAGFAKLNDAWHDLILEGSGNDYVRTFVDRLRLPLYRLLFTAFYQPHRIDDANRDHRLITAAITEGRADDAEKLMRAHIADALAAVETLSEDPPLWAR